MSAYSGPARRRGSVSTRHPVSKEYLCARYGMTDTPSGPPHYCRGLVAGCKCDWCIELIVDDAIKKRWVHPARKEEAIRLAEEHLGVKPVTKHMGLRHRAFAGLLGTK